MVGDALNSKHDCVKHDIEYIKIFLAIVKIFCFFSFFLGANCFQTLHYLFLSHPYLRGPVNNPSICGTRWVSDNLTPHHHVPFIRIHNLTKNRIESPLYRKLYQKYNMYNNISDDSSGLNILHQVISSHSAPFNHTLNTMHATMY